MTVSGERILEPGERGNEREQARSWQMKVCKQLIDNPKRLAGKQKNACFRPTGS
jgi:hypothetical protein